MVWEGQNWGTEKEGRSGGGVVVAVQWLSHVELFVTLWTEERQASLSFSISVSSLKLMSIELVMNENHLIPPSHPLLPASPPGGGLGRAVWQLWWRDCMKAGTPPALLIWQGRGRLQLPGAAKWSRQGAGGGWQRPALQRDDGAARPPPRNLSVKAILVNVPQVIEQNGYSAAFRWDIPQISVILYMLIHGVFEPMHMLTNFLPSCSISYWEGH